MRTFGYYRELMPELSIPDVSAPLHTDNYTDAVKALANVVLEDVQWFKDVCGSSMTHYTINTDCKSGPEVWYVTYHFNDEGSRVIPVQTDIFSLLWPDHDDFTDGDISQCVTCGAANVFGEPFADDIMRPVRQQHRTEPWSKVCPQCAHNQFTL